MCNIVNYIQFTVFHRLVSGRRVNKVLNELEVNRFNLDVAFKVDGLEWCSISKEKLFGLKRPFEEEEIRSTAFECGRDKSLG